MFPDVHAFTIGVVPMYNREMIANNHRPTSPPHHDIETTPRWTCFGEVLCEMMEWWPWQKQLLKP